MVQTVKRGGLVGLTVLAITAHAVRAQQAPSGHGQNWVPQRPEFMALAEEIKASDDPIHGRAQLGRLRARLAEPNVLPPEQVKLLGDLTMELLRVGEQAEALSMILRAFELVRGRPVLAKMSPSVVPAKSAMPPGNAAMLMASMLPRM